MSSVRDWLEGLGLSQYVDPFDENEIDLDLVRDLNDASLKELGVQVMGHRVRLLRAIGGLAKSGEQPAFREQSGTLAKSERSTTPGADAERRQLTVMFCDLVGSTALSQRLDPEALRDLMRNYQQCCGAVVEKFDGHVAQYLGDGLMVYFGWPRAHEDDAERAIRAGLEIVEAVKQLKAPESLHVRVGVATGPVVVGETGAGDASVPKVAVGETPNLAARIQGLAESDQIVIAPDTRRLVGGTFVLIDIGEHALKGIVEPVHAWQVTGLASREGRFDAAHSEAELTAMVGRDQEIGLLMERWQLAQDGEGQVVLLSGEPGIGKSRILSSLRDKLEGEGAKPMRYQCSPFYVNSAFWPSIDNLERTLKFARDETSESKLDKLEALIVGQYERPLSDVRFIASILSIPCDDRYGEIIITPQKQKDETLRTLVDLTEAAARKQPSVLMFEDAHWADPTTLEVLDLLIDRVTAMPLLIVLTHRPEFQNRWADHGHVTGLNMSRFTRAQSAAMVSRVTDGMKLPEELLEKILEKTDGVPLFVEELTKSILESGELKEAGDRYEYAGSARSVTVPATLRDSLMARLDHDIPVKEIAQIGAVIGREFSYELITAIAALQKTQLDHSLALLTDSGLAFRRGTPPEATYTFKHALVQDAAYDSLLRSRRQDLHGKIAGAIEERYIARVIAQRFPNVDSIESELLAHHYTEAGSIARAIPYWKQAGELALKRVALTEAIAHLSKGLELVVALPASAERDASELALRVPLGTAWMALKGWGSTEVWTCFHAALCLAQSLERNDTLVPILWGLMLNVMVQGRIAEALPWAEKMLDAAESTSNSDLLVTGHTGAYLCYYHMGRIVESLAHRDKVLALYDNERHRNLIDLLNHDPKTLVGTFSSICTWMLGYPDRAVQESEEATAHARALGHPFDLGWVFFQVAEVFDFRCEPEMVHKRVEECEQLGRENNLPVLSTVLAPMRNGIAIIRAGTAVEGVEQLKSGLAVWEASGSKIWSPYAKSVLAEGMAMLGDIDGALQLINEQIEQVERLGWEERHYYAETLRLKGWMLSLKDDLEGAEQNYLASLDWAREQQAKSWELRTSTSLAHLWQGQGKHKEAHDLLAPVYNWFTEGFDTKDLKEAEALLKELAA